MSVDMVALYEEGASIAAVAEAAGLSYRQARAQLLDAGVTLRPSSVVRKETLALADEAARLYASMPIKAVADRMGLSYTWTHELLHLAGAPIRDSQGLPRKAVA
jgi:hypothetical protein